MNKLALLLVAILLAAITLSPPFAVAQSTVRVTGGGTGTFADGDIDPWDLGNPPLDGDLDGDGDIDGSQFGIGVTIRTEDGSAQGHFLCLMAGRSDILGLSLMAVQGPVNTGTDNGSGSVSFSGVGTVNLGNGTIFSDIPFNVTVTAGGPGVGTLQLTVIGAFDGVPGDTLPGNGNYDLPVETVASGRIKIH